MIWGRRGQRPSFGRWPFSDNFQQDYPQGSNNRTLAKGDWYRLCSELINPANSGPVKVICKDGQYIGV